MILETERLALREFTLNDTEFIVNLLNSPGWLEFIGDRNVKNTDQAKDYLLNGAIKSYQENGFGLSLVELKHSKTPIGMCGLLKRDYLDNPDIGFAFLPDYTGKGYAFEVAKATINYAKDSLNIPCVMAITIPTNKRSINLLERVGLKFIKIITSQANDEELMLFGN
ncbi:MAG: GNAT family N-acetyltransferase [Bacteroidales bacterium]|nr:GNAT family N-acetyltransferase [Bacteroidales bacterium]